MENVKVLDPACGSGNFLSVALGELLDLEKRALTWAVDAGLKSQDGQTFVSRVRPEAMLGIEKNSYAQDLARTSIQITYLQWLHANGYGKPAEPILRHTNNISHADALFDIDTGEETVWPDAEFIVGNPPFLGDKKMRGELGEDYTRALRLLYKGRTSGASDLCCYWLEKARAQVESGRTQRVGLVTTQAVRAGKNRGALQRIKESGDIFFAVSDRDWRQDGANVHISLVAFDDGKEQSRWLDGEEVSSINANLTPDADMDFTQISALQANSSISYLGVMKGGSFDLDDATALAMLQSPNPDRRPNSDILRPRLNAQNIMQRTAGGWLIDFGLSREEDEASMYEQPFFVVEGCVRPQRLKSNRKRLAQKWWLHGEARPGLRGKLEGLRRCIVTPETSKHRVFVWLPPEFLPDHKTRVIVNPDDYTFGVVHSRLHELWSRRIGSQLREVESGFCYTSPCFETFPFPNPTTEQSEAIAKAAARLNQLRENWLNPPEWMKEETIEFRATENGPWHRYLVPNSVGANGIGLARWTRLVAERPNRPVQDFRYDPKMKQFRNFAVTTSDALSHRTLTNLYNQPPAWLQVAHRKLDEAVFAAYGWSADLTDDEILERLLALNLERAQQESEPVKAVEEAIAQVAPVYSVDEWRDAVGFHIVSRHWQEATFGRVKLQKLFFLAEASYQLPLAGEYARAALGPLDSKMIYPFEERAQEREWLQIHRRSSGDIIGTIYELGENADSAEKWSREVLGDAAQQLDELLDLLNGCNTETAEKVATLYAAWNDLLLQGQPATEKAILDEVLDNWHPNKQNIPRTIWRNALDWMKRESLVPKGQGAATSKSNE